MRNLDKATVSVGIPRGPVYPDGTSVAQVAAWDEFGTVHAPARPFLRTGMQRALPGAKALNKANLARVVRGGMTIYVALGQLGEFCVGEVKHAMIVGPWVPNSPETIRRKGSSKPLFDTSQMFQSVTSRIEAA